MLLPALPLRLLRPLCLALVALAACAPQSEWVKDGADAEEFRRDREACVSRGENYAFMDDRRGGRDRVGSSGAEIYRDCMVSRGWRRERTRS
jgi:hypothetical protein